MCTFCSSWDNVTVDDRWSLKHCTSHGCSYASEQTNSPDGLSPRAFSYETCWYDAEGRGSTESRKIYKINVNIEASNDASLARTPALHEQQPHRNFFGNHDAPLSRASLDEQNLVTAKDCDIDKIIKVGHAGLTAPL